MADPCLAPCASTWIQTWAVPIIGAAIAGAGVFIAYQQSRLAGVKLRHDLFDRRYALYNAAGEFLADNLTEAKISEDKLKEYHRIIRPAAFVFDDDIAAYFKTISSRAQAVLAIMGQMDGMEAGPERTALAKAKGSDLAWMMDQFDLMPSIFMPYMRLEQPSWIALWRAWRRRKPSKH